MLKAAKHENTHDIKGRKMNKQTYDGYVKILHEELLLATGCTEPISLAYAAALAGKTLGALPQKVHIEVSGNILKNVKSVIVPNTGGLKGITAAAAAGIISGNADKKLRVLESLSPESKATIEKYISDTEFSVVQSRSGCVFDILITVYAGQDSASVRIADHHTNVVYIEKNGTRIGGTNSDIDGDFTDRSILNVKDIIDFADRLNTDDVCDVLTRQIDCNTAIAREGLRGDYGARVGKVLLSSYGDTVQNRAKAYAAAGSDARMNGCNLPVVIISGSGNQSLTASLPVIVYAEHLGCTRDKLLRALALSDLITVHLKTGIGRLSAYCGAVSAGAGAGAGVCYLYGGKYDDIAHTIVNALAITSGLICDGAKSSCAAKIATSVDAGLMGMEMYRNGSQFFGGDGILERGVENTIDNVCDLARIGMKETDEEIIRLMIKNC